jgi:deazaflavin-dependent oxidoreductase (nitroreductase family)
VPDSTPEYLPSTTPHVREQVELIESSDGREGMELWGYPVIVFTHTGRRTGAIRKTPVLRVVTEDGAYILVGSRRGRPEHPQWYYNLRAHPEITIRDGERVFEAVAREVTDPEERARLWAVAVATFPGYDEYQQATERVIPLFALTPS